MLNKDCHGLVSYQYNRWIIWDNPFFLLKYHPLLKPLTKIPKIIRKEEIINLTTYIAELSVLFYDIPVGACVVVDGPEDSENPRMLPEKETLLLRERLLGENRSLGLVGKRPISKY